MRGVAPVPKSLRQKNLYSRELWQTHMNARHLRDYMAATEGAFEEFTLNEMIRIA